MSEFEDIRVYGRARLPFSDPAEIDEFVETLQRYERGELTPDEWRAFRLVRGTYGQRQGGDLSMVRIKIPQGYLEASCMRAIADAADQYSRGFAHLTTRGNVQLHFVALKDVENVMRRLAEAGATTRTACGNSVRNVTCCPYAGVSENEVFDPTPYAEALTRFFLRRPIAATLPRKFKIAFEGCTEDHALTAINDLGFSARVRTVNGRTQRGFHVTVAGGTSIWCRSGALLEDFVPAGEILELTEAVLRVFHRLGDREHKHRNRLKFLVKELGWERFREEYERERENVRAEGGISLPFDPDAPGREEGPPDWPRPAPPSVAECAARAASSRVRGPGITPVVRPLQVIDSVQETRWLKTNVRRQRQKGYVTAEVTVPLGDVTSEQLRILADLALSYSDGTLRITSTQNLLFRWVREEELPALYARLSASGLGLADARTLADVTSCPGAEVCRLAVTQSRGLGKLLGDFLRERPDLVDAVPGLDVKISGCPNGCGQHHIAGIGLQGSVRKVNGRPVPQYFVLLGGGVERDGARFGRLAVKIPARRIPEAVERLVRLYIAQRRDGESPRAFFQRVELAMVKEALADLESLPPEKLKPEDLIDLGDSVEFTVETMSGECAA